MKTERLGARAASGGGVFEIMHSAFMAGPDQGFFAVSQMQSQMQSQGTYYRTI